MEFDLTKWISEIEKVSEARQTVERIRENQEIKEIRFTDKTDYVKDEVVAKLAKCTNLRSADFTGCSQLTDGAAWY